MVSNNFDNSKNICTSISRKSCSENNFILKALLVVICLFPIATLFQGYFGFINIFLVFLLIGCFWLYFLNFGFKKKELLIDMIGILISFISLFFTDFPLHNKNIFFYFPIFVILFSFFLFRLENLVLTFKKCSHIISGLCFLWCVIIIISMLFPSSYLLEWNSISFVSFAGGTFRLTPTALFEITCLVYLVSQKRSIVYILMSFVPLFCFLFAGSRTYFVIGAMSELLLLYVYIHNNKKFILILFALGIIGIPIFLSSSIYQKFLFTSGTGLYDFLGTFTNGRTVFWEYDLKEFFKLDLIGLIFGNGYNFVYDVNSIYFNALIWAHNDFIQILTTHGFVGLFFYLYVIYLIFKKGTIGLKKQSFFFLFFVFFIWFFNAFFNMFYTYFCSVLCFPFYIISYRTYLIKY